MNDAPTLTVVVPCFDCERTLRRCIDSVLRSAEKCPTVKGILLVDGGSHDATSGLCKQLGAHPLITVIEHAEVSASAKRNISLRHVDSDYVLFTDPDCTVGEDWLPLMSGAAKRGWKCVTGRVTSVGEGHETSVRRGRRDKVFEPGLLNRAFAFRAGSSNNLMIEKRHLESIGAFPEDLGPGTANGVAEDTEVLYRTLLKGQSIHFVADAEVVHDMVETDEEFCRKKESYARGLSFFMLRRYRSDPATWVSIAASYGYSIASLVFYSLFFNRVRIRRALAELRGRWRGCVGGLRNSA